MSRWSQQNIDKIVSIMQSDGTIRQIVNALKPLYKADRFSFYMMEIGKDYFFPDEDPKIIRSMVYSWNKPSKGKGRRYIANLVNGDIRVRRLA